MYAEPRNSGAIANLGGGLLYLGWAGQASSSSGSMSGTAGTTLILNGRGPLRARRRRPRLVHRQHGHRGRAYAAQRTTVGSSTVTFTANNPNVGDLVVNNATATFHRWPVEHPDSGEPGTQQQHLGRTGNIVVTGSATLQGSLSGPAGSTFETLGTVTIGTLTVTERDVTFRGDTSLVGSNIFILSVGDVTLTNAATGTFHLRPAPEPGWGWARMVRRGPSSTTRGRWSKSPGPGRVTCTHMCSTPTPSPTWAVGCSTWAGLAKPAPVPVP